MNEIVETLTKETAKAWDVEAVVECVHDWLTLTFRIRQNKARNLPASMKGSYCRKCGGTLAIDPRGEPYIFDPLALGDDAAVLL